ncbi:MAG: hypothetical protein AAF346_00040 [Pseudomonadota bacterium]
MGKAVDFYDLGLTAEITSDGRLRIVSKEVRGLVLSSTDHDAVWRDLGPALQALLKRNENWPVDN